MKKLVVSKTNKQDNQIEYNEEYHIIDKQHVDAYLGNELDKCLNGQGQDLMCIRNLREGSYTLDAEDYWLDVEVMGK